MKNDKEENLKKKQMTGKHLYRENNDVEGFSLETLFWGL